MSFNYRLPEGWRWVTVEDVQSQEKRSTITGPFGSSIGSKFFVDKGIPVIRGNNLKLGSEKFVDDGFVFITEEKAEELKGYKAYPGDLLFTAAGTIGQVGIIPDNCAYEYYIISNKQMRARLDPSKIDAMFAYYWFSSNPMVSYIKALDTGSTIPLINLGILRKLPIPLPPLDEQIKIKRHLVSLDNKIEINRRTNQTLEAIAQTLFKSWFVDFDPVKAKLSVLAAGGSAEEAERAAMCAISARDGASLNTLQTEQPKAYAELARTAALFPSAMQDSELGEIPEGWELKPFGDLIESTIGGDWGKEAEDDKHTIEAVIIRGTDIPDLKQGGRSSAPTRWVESKKLKTRKLEDGDIVIEVSGGSPKQPTGRALYINQNLIDRLGGTVEPASFCRRFKSKNPEFGLYAAQHLHKIYADGKMWEYQNQSTGISNFQTKTFLAAEMVVMPDQEDVLNEFYRIVRPLVDKSTTDHQVLLAKLRDTLLPKLLSGELTLSDSTPIKANLPESDTLERQQQPMEAAG